MAILKRMNITITVPQGSSNHGNPNLLCVPTKWYEIVTFFATNYLTHAATVRSIPGESTLDSIITVILAFIYPYSGVMRGLEAISRHAIFSKNDVEKAGRAGVLCVVVRSTQWKPLEGVPYQGFIHQIDPQEVDDTTEVVHSLAPKPSTFQAKSAEWRLQAYDQLELIRRGQEIHGSYVLPAGFTLSILSSNAVVEPILRDQLGQGSPGNDVIFSSWNILPVLVSIVQILISCITLYRSQGDQLDQYGYAAFGLTVLPYMVMSLVNLVGNIFTPTYRLLYLIQSPEMLEAETRGGVFEGCVGRIVERISDDRSFSSAEFVGATEDGYLLRLDVPVQDDRSVKIEPKIHPTTVKRTLTPSEDVGLTSQQSETSPSQDIVDSTWECDTVYQLPPEPNIHESSWKASKNKFLVPLSTPYKKLNNSKGHRSGLPWLLLAMCGIPYAIIGGLTRFDPGNSTKSERVWIMSWLAIGVFGGSSISGVAAFEKQSRTVFRVWFFLVLLCSCFTLGGFVVVGQMLKSYGSCTVIE